MRRHLIVVIATVCAAGFLQISTADALHDGAVANLKLGIQASVPAVCGFSDRPASAKMQASSAGSAAAEIGFGIECNSPFRIVVDTESGFLRLQGPGTDGVEDKGAIATRIPYRLQLAGPGLNAPASMLACASGLLRSGACALEGQGVLSAEPSFGSQFQLLIATEVNPSPDDFAAGQYSEVIRISVESAF